MMDENKIKQALKAKISTSELSAEGQEVFFERFFELMKVKTSEQEVTFRKYIQTH